MARRSFFVFFPLTGGGGVRRFVENSTIFFVLFNKNSKGNRRLCGEKEIMKHLYDCKWNSENENVKFEKISGDNIKN